MHNKIIPYNPALKAKAKLLRKHSTLGEILLWQKLKNKALGYEFHRQVPIDNYIVDFFCHELFLALEIDGESHNFQDKIQQDEIRQTRLESLGVKFLRIQDKEVKQDMNNVIRSIQSKIVEIEEIRENNNIPLPPSKGE